MDQKQFGGDSDYCLFFFHKNGSINQNFVKFAIVSSWI